jgi:hypothetical protein
MNAANWKLPLILPDRSAYDISKISGTNASDPAE